MSGYQKLKPWRRELQGLTLSSYDDELRKSICEESRFGSRGHQPGIGLQIEPYGKLQWRKSLKTPPPCPKGKGPGRVHSRTADAGRVQTYPSVCCGGVACSS